MQSAMHTYIQCAFPITGIYILGKVQKMHHVIIHIIASSFFRTNTTIQNVCMTT